MRRGFETYLTVPKGARSIPCPNRCGKVVYQADDHGRPAYVDCDAPDCFAPSQHDEGLGVRHHLTCGDAQPARMARAER